MESVQGLQGIIEDIKTSLDAKESTREEVLKSGRIIVQLSRRIIGSIHRRDDASQMWKDSETEMEHMARLLEKEPPLRYAGYVENAHQEYCEARILFSITNGVDLPSPEELGVTPSSYLLGLGDTVGELRRLAVDALRVGDLDSAEGHLDSMDSIYLELNQFVYPSALVNIKPKCDVARSLLEKTRGEIAVAKTASRIGAHLQ